MHDTHSATGDLSIKRALPMSVSPSASQSTTVLERLTFAMDLEDEQGGPLSYVATGLPPYARFDESTATFSWLPRPGQEGSWVVTFAVTDANGRSETARVRIDVRTEQQHLERKRLASSDA